MQNLASTPAKVVTLGAAVGACTAILVWAVDQFGGIVIPAEIGISISTVLTFAAQQIKDKIDGIPDGQ
jgi:type III secretory pathway component EscT